MASSPVFISPVATGVAVMEAEQESEEDEARRKSHVGKDQIVYDSKKDYETVGKAIAGIYSDTYYNETAKKVYKKCDGWFGWGSAILFGGIAFCALGLWWMLTLSCAESGSCSYPFDLVTSIVISAGIGIVFGCILHNNDEPVDWLELSKIDSDSFKTRVLLKIYNDEGYRNINEDKVIAIQELM